MRRRQPEAGVPMREGAEMLSAIHPEAVLKPRTRIIEHATLPPSETALRFIENSPEKIKKVARHEAALHDRLYPALPADHPATKELQEMIGFLLQQVNLPNDFLRIKIYDSDYPDVHIQIQERTLRISRDFLKIIDGNPAEAATVMAHEIGHLLLAHYTARAQKTGGPMEIEDYDPLSERVQRYEHEYQADRASVIITNRLGLKPPPESFSKNKR